MKISKYTKELLVFFGIIVIVSLVVIGRFGLTLGIDFTGGAFTEVSYETVPAKQIVDDSIQALETDFGSYSLRRTGDESGTAGGYMLKTRDLTEPERIELHDTLLAQGTGAEISRFTSIGPVIGQELTDKALWAIGSIALIIVLYIMFAFREVPGPVHGATYGSIVFVVLLHDLLLPIAVMAFLGHSIGVEIDILFVTALLAVLGYSVNDTVVIFDRVREHLARDAKRLAEDNNAKIVPFNDTVDIAVNETFGRSINTSLTTILALAALYFFGGSVTQIFALTLIVGIIAGTYSSLFIANPLLIKAAERAIKKQK